MLLSTYNLNGTAQRKDIQTSVSMLLISGTVIRTTTQANATEARNAIITALGNSYVTISKVSNGETRQIINNVSWADLFEISAATNRMTFTDYTGGSSTTWTSTFRFYVPIAVIGALFADKADFITIEDTAGAVANYTTTLTINYLGSLSTTNEMVKLDKASVIQNQTASFDCSSYNTLFLKQGTFSKIRLFGTSGSSVEMTSTEVNALHLLSSDLAHNVVYLGNGNMQDTKDLKAINIHNVYKIEIDSTATETHYLYTI